MEVVKFEGLDKLASPVDQAKMAGLLKEPEQIQKAQKHKYILFGMGIAAIVIIAFVIVASSMEKKEES